MMLTKIYPGEVVYIDGCGAAMVLEPGDEGAWYVENFDLGVFVAPERDMQAGSLTVQS